MRDPFASLDSTRITFDNLPTPLRQEARDCFRSEVTYLANAAEGSSLTREETVLILETGHTSGSRTWQEYLQAVNFAEAWDYVVSLAPLKKPSQITESDISRIHRLTGFRLDLYAGLTKEQTSLKPIIALLGRAEKEHPVELAEKLLKECSALKAFKTGNTLIAHLLANLVLLQAGYPPALLSDTVPRGLERSFEVLRERQKTPDDTSPLITIGELARLTDESPATLRYWTNAGILSLAKRRRSGYRLYDATAISRVREVRAMQHGDRRTLAEIKQLVGHKK